jgi:hypothetical protein
MSEPRSVSGYAMGMTGGLAIDADNRKLQDDAGGRSCHKYK